MPQKRQAGRADEESIAVRTLGLRFPHDHLIEPHAHAWQQLVYATRGVMTVSTQQGAWVVPAQRAVWIPAGFEHAIRATGRVRMRTLYFRPDLSEGLSDSCWVGSVTPLLRELILETFRIGMLRDDVPEHVRWTGVLLDQLARSPEAPLEIKLPTDERARRVAEHIRGDLTATAPISRLVEGSGAGVRTIERLFLRETGLTVGRWRQRAKVLAALQRLAAGDSVTAAGLAVGYDSTSAFIAMFKRVLGTTPGSYFSLPASEALEMDGPESGPRE
jgi:AraC-like DNA-binding protein